MMRRVARAFYLAGPSHSVESSGTNEKFYPGGTHMSQLERIKTLYGAEMDALIHKLKSSKGDSDDTKAQTVSDVINAFLYIASGVAGEDIGFHFCMFRLGSAIFPQARGVLARRLGLNAEEFQGEFVEVVEWGGPALCDPAGGTWSGGKSHLCAAQTGVVADPPRPPELVCWFGRADAPPTT
jgi:hypothetical protein